MWFNFQNQNKKADDLFSSLDFGGSPPLTALSTASTATTPRVESSSNLKSSGSGLAIKWLFWCFDLPFIVVECFLIVSLN